MLGPTEVLEPVLTEIPQRHIRRQLAGNQFARRGRYQHLPTVAGRTDPSRAMDVEADVVIALLRRLAGVHADPHAHLHAVGPRLPCKRSLYRDRRGNRVARPRKRDEEPVPLRVDHPATVLAKRRAQHTIVLAQNIGVPTAQPLQQPSRALDVAE